MVHNGRHLHIRMNMYYPYRKIFFIVIKIKQLKVKRAIKITAKQIGDVERVGS